LAGAQHSDDRQRTACHGHHIGGRLSEQKALAITRSIVSDPRADVAACEHFRPRSTGLCGRSDPGTLGLSSISGAIPCHIARHQVPFEADRSQELEYLTDLLNRPAGVAAGEVAQQLLAHYKSFGALLVSAISGKRRSEIVSPEVWGHLEAFARLISTAWRQEAVREQIISTSEALLTYLQFDMCGLERECFRVLFLDSANNLIDDRLLWEGTINRVHAYPREVIRLAIELSATAVILVHNHPQGNARPSQDDILLTRKISNACAAVEVVVHDHIIVARNGTFSFALNSMISPLHQSTHPLGDARI
jgi:DNA repair protein RadC